eukprot:CAMPEP_0205953370 /NCGR_PEP_ID=MMETSP1459-20131121/17020_1 /ASSEMBLY_ACC=CAM_ASM_001120 /TAXON_ID=41880 /ORGANISM="Pycnococcus provasolii, Strain RCC931" /LENGTH=72 /DNA_ID=CAMNT_0053325481 /DNA_START=165 /DNA_END=383 /DNA_ORIENTATION=-
MSAVLSLDFTCFSSALCTTLDNEFIEVRIYGSTANRAWVQNTMANVNISIVDEDDYSAYVAAFHTFDQEFAA